MMAFQYNFYNFACYERTDVAVTGTIATSRKIKSIHYKLLFIKKPFI